MITRLGIILLGRHTGWSPEKVSHYHEPPLNRIKNANEARFFISFDYISSTRISKVFFKYSLSDLSCDVVSCCASGESNAYDKIAFENWKWK